MFEMFNTPGVIASIIGATIGALLGSASSILFGILVDTRKQKRARVEALYEEYNSQEMRDYRFLTGQFFELRPRGMGYSQLRKRFMDPDIMEIKVDEGEVSREQFEAFRNLSVFFEKVYMLKKHRFLNRKLTLSLIGVYVCGWANEGWLAFLDDTDTETQEHFHHRKQNFWELYKWVNCAPKRSLYGLWADQGVDVSAEDIDEMRRDMLANFSREDIT